MIAILFVSLLLCNHNRTLETYYLQISKLVVKKEELEWSYIQIPLAYCKLRRSYYVAVDLIFISIRPMRF